MNKQNSSTINEFQKKQNQQNLRWISFKWKIQMEGQHALVFLFPHLLPNSAIICSAATWAIQCLKLCPSSRDLPTHTKCNRYDNDNGRSPHLVERPSLLCGGNNLLWRQDEPVQTGVPQLNAED